jgi:hypothetical protein
VVIDAGLEFSNAAACVSPASGPRYAIISGFSSAIAADMITVNRRSASFRIGLVLPR